MKNRLRRDVIFLCTAQGDFDAWTPGQADLLADDWKIDVPAAKS